VAQLNSAKTSQQSAREIDSTMDIRKMLENLDNFAFQSPAAILEQQAHLINFRKQRITHMNGLREIVLQRNKLGDKFARMLEKTLQYDRYLKVVNVAGNEISREGLQQILKLALIDNTSIVAFDARCNPGFSSKVQRQFALCMLKNIEKMKQKGAPIKKGWIRWELVSVGIPK
jgi:hypothetical protein